MGWITPKTNWVATDPLTHTDFNRIKNNLVYLNDIYNNVFEPYTMDLGADMVLDQMFANASVWNAFEDCIESFKTRSGIIHNYGPRSYYRDNGHLPNYNQLNRLEKLILAYSNYDVRVTGITLDSPIRKFHDGNFPVTNAYQYIPNITPNGASDKGVSWSSSDTTLATIDSNGYVTLLKGGKAVITATTHDGGFTATSDFYSVIKVSNILLTEPIQVGIGTTYDISQDIQIVPNNANYVEYSFASSDETIFTVNNLGVIGGVGKGTAYLTVRTVQNPASTGNSGYIKEKTFEVNVGVNGTYYLPDTYGAQFPYDFILISKDDATSPSQYNTVTMLSKYAVGGTPYGSSFTTYIKPELDRIYNDDFSDRLKARVNLAQGKYTNYNKTRSTYNAYLRVLSATEVGFGSISPIGESQDVAYSYF